MINTIKYTPLLHSADSARHNGVKVRLVTTFLHQLSAPSKHWASVSKQQLFHHLIRRLLHHDPIMQRLYTLYPYCCTEKEISLTCTTAGCGDLRDQMAP